MHKLAARAEAGRPVRAGLIGAGKFGSMFLSQVPTIPGLEVAVIADLDVDRAREACRRVGWDEQRIARTRFVDSGLEACAGDGVEVVIEATGSPVAGIAHALAAIEAGRHIVMVNVEADVLAGPLLAAKARERGVVYSMAYGDQPALVAEMVDWARAAGFTVAAAGKGTKYLPLYHTVTPDDVWDALRPDAGGGQGRGHEPADVQLLPRRHQVGDRDGGDRQCLRARGAGDGLLFRLAAWTIWPTSSGRASKAASSRARAWSRWCPRSSATAGRWPRDLRWGVYVVLKAPNDYAAACFGQYGLRTDASGRYAAMYKPFHLIGLELSISVLNAALRGEPTGAAQAWRGDPVAVAKRYAQARRDPRRRGRLHGLRQGGSGGPQPRRRALPIGLAHGVTLRREVPAGAIVREQDVTLDEGALAVRVRRQMVEAFRPAGYRQRALAARNPAFAAMACRGHKTAPDPRRRSNPDSGDRINNAVQILAGGSDD